MVRLTDDQLFNCPITVMSDAGTIGIRDDEAERLRTYLLKGGFRADDFWGTAAWEQWESQIAKVMPPADYPIEDVRLDDPMLHSLFEVKKIPQITNIQFWRRSGDRRPGTRSRQRGRPLPGDSRQAAPRHGAHDAQHRCGGLMGARGRGSRLLLSVLAGGICTRDRCADPCDDALSAFATKGTKISATKIRKSS